MIKTYRLKKILSEFVKSRAFNNGIPFVLFIILCPLALKQFATVRYDHSGRRRDNTEQLKKMGLRVQDVQDEDKALPTILELYAEMMKNMEATYENIRGPREFEDNVDAIDLIVKKIWMAKKADPSLVIQSDPLVMERLAKLEEFEKAKMENKT